MPHDASEAAGATHDGAMETRGLEPVPDAERTGRVRELFPTWVAANISVLLLTMGAGLIVFNGLNFWQVLAVAVAAPVLSYGIVGLISIAGKRGGAPGMALSRAVFGQRGNLFPGALIWVARWGWETINAVTGAYAVLTVLDLLFGVRSNTLLIVVTLLLFVTCTFLVSGLGINALRVCSKWSTYLFGAFSVLVLVYLVANTDWSAVFDKLGRFDGDDDRGHQHDRGRRHQLGPLGSRLHPLPAPYGLVEGDGRLDGGRRRDRRPADGPDGRGHGGVDAGPGLGAGPGVLHR